VRQALEHYGQDPAKTLECCDEVTANAFQLIEGVGSDKPVLGTPFDPVVQMFVNGR